MNRIIFFLFSILLIGSFLPSSQANVDSTIYRQQDPTGRPFTKSINKLFKVANTGDLRLDNRHGDITYAVWDRNEVKIAVLIEIDASSESKADEVFNRISIDVSNGNSFVAAKTEIAAGGGSWWGNSNSSFKINYTVSAPEGWNVDFANSYGDVRIPDLAKDVKLDIRYGDLFTGNISGNTDLSVSYGDAHLGKLQKLDATFKYADIEIKSATLTTINSKYSETRIKRLVRLYLDSQYDEFDIGSVKEFVNAGRYDNFKIDSAWSVKLDSRYTDIRINYLAEDVELDMRHGDAHVGSTAPQLANVNMSGEYTDFTIRLHSAVEYSLEAKGNYSDIDVPSSLKMMRKEEIGSSSNYSGRFGAEPKAKIIMNTSYGSIDIR